MDVPTCSCIDRLPENILLEIFTYLSVDQLCKVGRVCKSWRRISMDRRLWRCVDLTAQKTGLMQLWKLVKSPFVEAVSTLRLRGYLDAGHGMVKRDSISKASLQRISNACPRLINLHLTHTDLSKVTGADLPDKLTTLSITHCFLTYRWFIGSDLQCLQKLDLSHSRLLEANLIHLCNAVSDRLEYLRLDGCYRLTSACIKTLATHMAQLKSLYLSRLCCTNAAAYHIGRHLTHLQHLDVSSWPHLLDNAVTYLVTRLPRLQVLNIEGCGQLTDHSIVQLRQLTHLNVLHLSTAFFTPSVLDDFRKHLPDCVLKASGECSIPSAHLQLCPVLLL